MQFLACSLSRVDRSIQFQISVPTISTSMGNAGAQVLICFIPDFSTHGEYRVPVSSLDSRGRKTPEGGYLTAG